MKLLKPRTFIIFALAGLSGTVLLHTSQNVQQAEERLETLELSLYREQEKTRMLRAEWETLNRPDRLERLANEFLDLVPPSPDQMTIDDEVLPDSLPAEYQVEESYEPVLQPVMFEAAQQSTPKPSHKPIIKPRAPSKPKAKPQKEKAFGDLLNELGGD